MGKLMEKYASAMRKDPLFVVHNGEGSEKELKKAAKEQITEGLKPFIEAESDKATFEVVFGYADAKGNLLATDESGVKVILSAEELKSDLEWYRGYVKDKFVGTPFIAMVSKIDKRNGVVYVKSGKADRESDNVRLMRELDAELKKGEKPVVPCRVTSIQDNAVYVDICGGRVLGICDIANWSKAFTRDLKSQVNVGDIMDFVVDTKIKRRKGTLTAYGLDRKPLTPEPWGAIPQDMFQEKAVILVKCIDKPLGKSYWWGKCAMVPGIEIMGNFNDKFEGGVMVDVTYKCKIREIDVEKKRFRVSPFEPVHTAAFERAVKFKKERPSAAVI